MTKSRRALVALNVTLLTLVAIVTFSPITQAQPTAGRDRGDYSMVGGAIVGGTPNVVYVIDSNNNEMVAVRWSTARGQLEPVGFRDLEADSKVENQGGKR